MSQKKRDFQSKPRFGGQKFKGDRPFREKPRGDRPNRDFGERFERDKDKDRERGADDRPAGRRPFDRDARPPRRDRDVERGGNRPRGRSFEKRDSDRQEDRRPFDRDARPPRRDRDFERGGDRPRGKSFEKRGSDRQEGRRDDRRDSHPFRSDDRKGGFKGKKPFHKDRPQKNFVRHEERPTPREFDKARLKSDRPSYGAPSSAFLYGVHAVSEALLNPKRVHQRLLCTQKGYESLAESWQEAVNENIALPQVTYVEKEDIDRLLPRDAVHQDVLLDSQPLEEIFLSDVLIAAPENAKVLLLDQVTDPHNVGAILRSAAGFGALAVVVQKVHAPDITGTLAKAASGAVEHVPLVREVNLSRALEQLKEAGFFCIGLDEDGKRPLSQMNLKGKIALVLGAEGAGLRRLVAENCDELARLPTQGPIGSLNVSNAAAVALYEMVRAGGE